MGSRSRHPHEKDSSNSKQDTPRHDERTLSYPHRGSLVVRVKNSYHEFESWCQWRGPLNMSYVWDGCRPRYLTDAQNDVTNIASHDLTRARRKGDKDAAESHPLESNELGSLFDKSDVSSIPKDDGLTVPNIPNLLRIEPRKHPSEEMETSESRHFPGVSGVTMPEGKQNGGGEVPTMPNMPNGGRIPTIPSGKPDMPNGGKIPKAPSGGKVPTMPGGMPNSRGNVQPPSSTRAHVLSESRSFNVNSKKVNSDSRINPTIPGIPGLPNQPDFPSFPEKPKNNTGNMTESEIPGVVIPAYAMKIE
ncbi:hypothetical protein TNCV_3172131 [Trichonephila clavipes]|nr:hypothetical protein TNCV_3172131 [Trichonephila clavipes]